jgi:hypothetical protein
MDQVDARRMRARSQGLHGPPWLPGPVDVARHLVGVQAQDARAAALMVRSRTAGTTAAEVAAAVDAGACVVTWTLRGTRHLHAAEDVRPLLALLGPRYTRPTRRAADLGIDGAVGEAAVLALRRAVGRGPLTRPEAVRLLEPLGVDTRGQAPIHLLRRAALEGVLCVLTGAVERYVALDDVAARSGTVDVEHEAGRLARRHLAACGPATPEDLATWSGLPLGAARRAWRALGGDLVEVGESGRRAWVLKGQHETLRRAAAEPAGCCLLGGFDSLLLGYADRTLHVPADRVRDVNAGGGMVRPVVVADGLVVGTWRLVPRGAGGEVRVHPFEDIGAHHEVLTREVADVGRFLDRAPLSLAVEDLVLR